MHAVRDALDRGGVRRRLRRGDGRRRPRDRLPRRARARRRSRGGRRLVLVPPGDIERSDQRIDELLSDPHAPARGAPAARATVPRTSRGSAAASRRSPPTSTRCGEAACCSSPATRPPTAWGRSRACTSARGSSWRCSAAATSTAAPVRGRAAVPPSTRAPARAVRARRQRRLPRGRRARPAGAWRRWRPGLGARRARVPLILWASLWAHPRSAAHALSYLPLRRLYRSADAVVTYGPHVSAYVRRARRAQRVRRAAVGRQRLLARARAAAPSARAWPAGAQTRFLFVGRDARGEGRGGADRRLAPGRPARAGRGARARRAVGRAACASPPAGAVASDPVAPAELRDIYAACDVLVVPSIPTRTFREPWGLVVNEAMNRGLAVIACDAVGAAAGGLVRDGVNGLVVAGRRRRGAGGGDQAPGRRRAAARAARRQAAQDVRAYSHDAWARGLLEAPGKPRPRPRALVALRTLHYENRPAQDDRPAAPARARGAGVLARALRRRRSADIGTNDHRTLHARAVARRLQPAGLPPRAAGAADGSRRVLGLRQPDPPRPARRRAAAAAAAQRGGSAAVATAADALRAAARCQPRGELRRRAADASAASSCSPGVVHANISSAFSSLPDPLLATARLPARLRARARRARDLRNRDPWPARSRTAPRPARRGAGEPPRRRRGRGTRARRARPRAARRASAGARAAPGGRRC